MPSVPPKTSPSAQNMKMGPSTLRTAENESGGWKHENGRRRPRFRRKQVRACKTLTWDATPSVMPKTCPVAENMKSRPDALRIAKKISGSGKHENGLRRLGTAENEFTRAKHENGTRRTRHRRKHVRKGKTWKWDRTPSIPSKMS
jgi:hypothetical protein